MTSVGVYQPLYPDLPALPEANVHHLFFNRPDQKTWPKDFVLHIDGVTGEKRSFSEFKERVRDGATALGASVDIGGLGLLGGISVSQGGNGTVDPNISIVGIISENSMDYVVLIHALLTITTPFALIAASSTPFELKHALTTSRATHLFVDAKYMPLVLSVATELSLPSHNIYHLNGLGHGTRKSLGDLIAGIRLRGVARVGVSVAKRDTLAYLVFSSGTGGLPKAVTISHGNLAFSCAQIIVSAAATAQVYTMPTPDTEEGITVSLGLLPLHHSYGLHWFCFRNFLKPETIVWMPKWEINLALQLIRKYRITALGLVPTMIREIISHPSKTKREDLTSLIAIWSGASYLAPEMWTQMREIVSPRAVFWEGYGMSEATIGAISPSYPGALGGRVKRKPGCAGILLPGVQARLVNDAGENVTKPGEVGELWIKSGSITSGYWNNPTANQTAFSHDGWLKTGDQFYVDDEGDFFYADRSKDTLKISGRQVSPMEIEQVLLSHPSKLLAEATVAAVSPKNEGANTSSEKVPRAWVVLSDAGRRAAPEAIIDQLETWHHSNLSKYKWLRGGIEIVDEIPKSNIGKTLRRVLQEAYEAERLKPRDVKL